MIKLSSRVPAALVCMFLALPAAALAQGSAPSFSGLEEGSRGRTAAGASQARNRADREAILFLANHVKSLDAAIAQNRKAQQEILDEARRREEEARRRAEEAERRRRQANSRAAGNALLLLAGADPKDVNTYNRLMDVRDIVSAPNTEARRDAQRHAIASDALLLLGADVRTVNDLDTFSGAVGVMSQASRARAMKQELTNARRNTTAAAGRSMTLEEAIKSLESERARALDLLAGYSKRYLAEVNGIVASIPGFADTFGAVKDIAFDFSQGPDSTAPLILALTFTVRAETVDVRLADIEQFLGDRFAKLIAGRESAARQAKNTADGKWAELDALVTQKADLEDQIRAKQAERAKLTGLRNFAARSRIDSDIERLRKAIPSQEKETALRATIRGLEGDHKKAEALLERAKAARAMLAKLDETRAKAALEKIRALL
ncbi:MAG: hypothetical protein HYY25_02790 [Candidatus Wallbacteria bacterium]|nr:hypothetical protein [Candidatus Wallbacteria bacterium]